MEVHKCMGTKTKTCWKTTKHTETPSCWHTEHNPWRWHHLPWCQIEGMDPANCWRCTLEWTSNWMEKWMHNKNSKWIWQPSNAWTQDWNNGIESKATILPHFYTDPSSPQLITILAQQTRTKPSMISKILCPKSIHIHKKPAHYIRTKHELSYLLPTSQHPKWLPTPYSPQSPNHTRCLSLPLPTEHPNWEGSAVVWRC